MNKILQNKLKAYTSLTAVAVIGTLESEAQVMYTNVNYTGGFESYDIDIDGDNTIDFTMNQESLWSSIGTVNRQFLYALNGASFIWSSSNGMFGYPGVKGLGSAYLIDSNASVWYGNYNLVWGGYGGTMGVYYNVYSGAYLGNEGDFGGTTSGKFVGVNFDISGARHYGWLRFETNATNDSWTLVDMAYDATPGTPITTGFIPLNVNKNQKQDFNLFATESELNIFTDIDMINSILTVIDMSGKVLINQKITSTHEKIQHYLPKGVYVVRLSNQDSIISNKVII